MAEEQGFRWIPKRVMEGRPELRDLRVEVEENRADQAVPIPHCSPPYLLRWSQLLAFRDSCGTDCCDR
jgi:hypothetical protein